MDCGKHPLMSLFIQYDLVSYIFSITMGLGFLYFFFGGGGHSVLYNETQAKRCLFDAFFQ